VWAMAFDSDSCILASGDRNGVVYLWDVLTGQQQLTFKAYDDNPVCAIAFNPVRKMLATGNSSGLVKLWITEPERD